jgi:tRNA-dihydrouridine synthase
MLLAEIDELLWGTACGSGFRGSGFSRESVENSRHAALLAYCRYIETELGRGTPLKAMTRHLLGIYARERGGRKWRRALATLADGTAGLDGLRGLIRANAESLYSGVADLARIASPVFQAT